MTNLLDIDTAACQHPQCAGRVDPDVPKFILIRGGAAGHEADILHHDCAAQLGHQAAEIVWRNAGYARDGDLAAILTDPNHPVHAASAAEISAL